MCYSEKEHKLHCTFSDKWDGASGDTDMKKTEYSSISLPQFSLSTKFLNLSSVAEEGSRTS